MAKFTMTDLQSYDLLMMKVLSLLQDEDQKLASQRFVGDDCGLCKDSQWSLERKQFPGTRATR